MIVNCSVTKNTSSTTFATLHYLNYYKNDSNTRNDKDCVDIYYIRYVLKWQDCLVYIYIKEHVSKKKTPKIEPTYVNTALDH